MRRRLRLRGTPFGGRAAPAALAAALALAAPTRPAGALDPHKAIGHYNHQVWTADDGLPHNTTLAILQTADGYLWLGGYEGLARFNGSEFTVFSRRNTPALLSDGIQALAEGRDGSLWVGTQEGLCRLHQGRWTRYAKPRGLNSDDVLALVVDASGAVWIGTNGGGLGRYDGQTFRWWTRSDGLADDTVQSLHLDRRGRLWIGTNQGLSWLERERLGHPAAAQALAGSAITAILEDHGGALWVGTDTDGLARLADGRLTRYTRRDGLSGNPISRLYQDRDGNLWVGSYIGGLNRFRDGRFEPFGIAHGLSNDTVRSLFEDREGSLWVGTNGGVNRFKDGVVSSFTTRDGLSNDYTRAILEDRHGNLWVGTSGGLNRLRGDRFEVPPGLGALATASVVAIAESPEGDLWLGTLGAGASRLRGGALRTYTAADGLASDIVRAIAVGRDGSVWVGTQAGLSRLRGERIDTWDRSAGLASDFVISLHEDRTGTLWIGTAAGVAALRDGRLRSYTTEDGFPGRRVFAFHEDHEGVLWMGTDRGLVRRAGGRLQTFTTRNGLFDDVAFRILEDGERSLWMSCNRGIYRVRRGDLEAFAAARVGTLRSLSFGRAEGMKSPQCNGNSQPAGWRARDGRLWFPTARGVVAIDPRETVRSNRVPPPVVIERVLVDQEPADPGQPIVAPPGTRKLQFDYAGLSFLAPEKVRFRFRLAGYDEDWVEAGARRTAFYTNLAPGAYRFQVLASNNDGVWNERGATVELRLSPFPWQRPSFYVAGALSLLLVGWLVDRVRRHLRQARNALLTERDRLAREIEALSLTAATDDLTGLANRRRFAELFHIELARARRSRQPLSLILADVDQLKVINDTHGHQAGDAAIRHVAAALRRGCRETDVPARLGGEEFAVLLAGSEEEGVRAVAERIRREVADCPVPQVGTVTISLGVATLPVDAGDEQELLRVADQRLYAAKAGGRNRVGFAGGRSPS